MCSSSIKFFSTQILTLFSCHVRHPYAHTDMGSSWHRESIVKQLFWNGLGPTDVCTYYLHTWLCTCYCVCIYIYRMCCFDFSSRWCIFGAVWWTQSPCLRPGKKSSWPTLLHFSGSDLVYVKFGPGLKASVQSLNLHINLTVHPFIPFPSSFICLLHLAT